MKSKGLIITLWVFGVVLALVPLILEYRHKSFDAQTSWVSLIMHGELLLISLAILGDTIARAATSDDDKVIRLIVGLTSFLVAILLISDFGDIRARVGDLKFVSEYSRIGTMILSASRFYFGASLLLSFFVVVFLED